MVDVSTCTFIVRQIYFPYHLTNSQPINVTRVSRNAACYTKFASSWQLPYLSWLYMYIRGKIIIWILLSERMTIHIFTFAKNTCYSAPLLSWRLPTLCGVTIWSQADNAWHNPRYIPLVKCVAAPLRGFMTEKSLQEPPRVCTHGLGVFCIMRFSCLRRRIRNYISIRDISLVYIAITCGDGFNTSCLSIHFVWKFPASFLGTLAAVAFLLLLFIIVFFLFFIVLANFSEVL